MADMTIHGLPLSLTVSEARQRADLLSLHGKQEEADLLHALLDGYAPGGRSISTLEKKLDDLQEKLEEVEEDLSTSEKRAEEAETRCSQISELAHEAGERLHAALDSIPKGAHPRVRALVAEALGLLVSATAAPAKEGPQGPRN